MTNLPAARPRAPFFSSGPCAKRPGWTLENLKTDTLGRSHRAKLGKARLKRAIDLTREVLEVPADYRIGIVPASDTGAVEMALWSMLGARPVDMLAWESFGEGWVTDVVKQLKLEGRPRHQGRLRRTARPRRGRHRTAMSSSPGTARRRACASPNADWIAADRAGLTICDATSAAFAQRLDFAKLDVVTFSWQKALGGEAAHGMLILSPRAVERLETYKPAWPLPKIFRMTKGGKLIEGIFEGETINTPSMLCVEDYIDALEWAKSVGGLKALVAKADANAKVIGDWVDAHALDQEPRQGPGDGIEYQRLPRHRRSRCRRERPRGRGAGRQGHRRQPRQGRRRLRHRRLPRRAGRPAHLVRRDGRGLGPRSPDAVARLGPSRRRRRSSSRRRSRRDRHPRARPADPTDFSP